MRSVLTSKLIENKIIVIDSEKLNDYKTKNLASYLNFMKENKFLFITSSNPCKNFLFASKPLKFLQHTLPKVNHNFFNFSLGFKCKNYARIKIPHIYS